jgi:hypothetical protein
MTRYHARNARAARFARDAARREREATAWDVAVWLVLTPVLVVTAPWWVGILHRALWGQ